jgi:hypothetical protein
VLALQVSATCPLLAVAVSPIGGVGALVPEVEPPELEPPELELPEEVPPETELPPPALPSEPPLPLPQAARKRAHRITRPRRNGEKHPGFMTGSGSAQGEEPDSSSDFGPAGMSKWLSGKAI